MNTLNCAVCAVFVGVLSTRKQGLNTWCFEPGKNKTKKKSLTELHVKGHFTEDRDEWQQKKQRHCEQVYTDMEGEQHFTEEGRIAEIKIDLVFKRGRR